jgi:predicted nucleic acid-binding protein
MPEGASPIAAALDLFISRLRVDFSDCLILETSRKAGHLPLATFDRDLSKCDGSELI